MAFFLSFTTERAPEWPRMWWLHVPLFHCNDRNVRAEAACVGTFTAYDGTVKAREWLEGNATGTMWFMVAGVLAYVALASLLQPIAVARLIYGTQESGTTYARSSASTVVVVMLVSTVLQNGYYGDYPDVIPLRKASGRKEPNFHLPSSLEHSIAQI